MQDYESWKKGFTSKKELYRQIYHHMTDPYYWDGKSEDKFVEEGVFRVTEDHIRDLYISRLKHEESNLELEISWKKSTGADATREQEELRKLRNLEQTAYKPKSSRSTFSTYDTTYEPKPAKRVIHDWVYDEDRKLQIRDDWPYYDEVVERNKIRAAQKAKATLFNKIASLFANINKLTPVTTYYPDGETVKEVYTTDQYGLKHGEYKEYYDEKYIHNAQGNFAKVPANGQLKRKCTYKDGEYDGMYETYHDNGQLEVKCTYKNGKSEGPYERYYDNGQLAVKCTTYKNNKLEGSHEIYYRNGRLEYRCQYKADKKNGICETYYQWTDCLKEKITYKDDIKDGPYEQYHDNGRLYEKGTYKKDKRVGLWERYYSNGQLELRCTFNDGYEDGILEKYDSRGRLLRKTTYFLERRGDEVFQHFITDKEVEEGKKALKEKLEHLSKTTSSRAQLRTEARAEIAKFRKQYHQPRRADRKPKGKDR